MRKNTEGKRGKLLKVFSSIMALFHCLVHFQLFGTMTIRFHGDLAQHLQLLKKWEFKYCLALLLRTLYSISYIDFSILGSLSIFMQWSIKNIMSIFIQLLLQPSMSIGLNSIWISGEQWFHVLFWEKRWTIGQWQFGVYADASKQQMLIVDMNSLGVSLETSHLAQTLLSIISTIQTIVETIPLSVQFGILYSIPA